MHVLFRFLVSISQQSFLLTATALNRQMVLTNNETFSGEKRIPMSAMEPPKMNVVRSLLVVVQWNFKAVLVVVSVACQKVLPIS